MKNKILKVIKWYFIYYVINRPLFWANSLVGKNKNIASGIGHV